MITVPTVQRKAALLAAFLTLVLLLVWRSGAHYRNPVGSESYLSKPANNHTVDSLFQAQVEFWKNFHKILEKSKPDCDSPKRMGTADAVGFDATKELQRPDLTAMPEEDVLKMRHAHSKFVNSLQAMAPKLKGAYRSGTRGIVSTAGGPYLPVFVISLQMLRRTGSKMPVEVLLSSKSEYESEICEGVLPELNAKCIVLTDILEASGHTKPIEHYQLKCFAMLFTSFEEFLFLDADAFPAYDPKDLFTNEPFISKGMVMWPDFWGSSASSKFYEISGQSVPPMSKRQSTESGEVLLHKGTHAKALLLATYYNYYGPSHYYILLSQGAPGEGDKETFCAAADALNMRYYQTSERVTVLGKPNKDGGCDGSAMVQFDPVQDYNQTSHGIWRVKDPGAGQKPRPFFVHVNYPKFNPATIFQEGGPTKDLEGKDARAWRMYQDTIDSFGYDLEQAYWEKIEWTACELETKFRSWQGQRDICARVKSYWNIVFGTPLERILEHHGSSKTTG